MEKTIGEKRMNALAKAPESGTDLHPIVDMAFRIADSAARSDIECNCAHHSGDAKTGWWYDTTKIEAFAEDWREDIDLAINYCAQRNLLDRMPGAPHIVSFIERDPP